MKRFLLWEVYIATMTAQAGEVPLWMRHCAVSPDGGQITFTYSSDINTMDTGVGKARQVTSSRGYGVHPMWSRDGKSMAFTFGGRSMVFIAGRYGGMTRRQTAGG